MGGIRVNTGRGVDDTTSVHHQESLDQVPSPTKDLEPTSLPRTRTHVTTLLFPGPCSDGCKLFLIYTPRSQSLWKDYCDETLCHSRMDEPPRFVRLVLRSFRTVPKHVVPFPTYSTDYPRTVETTHLLMSDVRLFRRNILRRPSVTPVIVLPSRRPSSSTSSRHRGL